MAKKISRSHLFIGAAAILFGIPIAAFTVNEILTGAVTPPVYTCSDSDGNNEFTSGSVNYSITYNGRRSGPYTLKDICYSATKKVSEYYCNGTRPAQKSVTCAAGCSNGACNSAQPPAPVCGNGRVEAPEECEDGNAVSGDGCENCLSACIDSDGGVMPNVSGKASRSSPSREIIIEDRCVNRATEANFARYDLIEAKCEGREPVGYPVTCQYGCSNGACNSAPPPAPVCGNGRVEPPEQCESGANCSRSERCDSCRCVPLALCGNGRIEPPEQCEGITGCTGTQKCNSSCQCVQPAPVCGNGIKEVAEQCDSGIGCTSPQICNNSTCLCVQPAPVCGDGRIEAPEECEDGNAENGDGCENCAFVCSDSDGGIVPNSAGIVVDGRSRYTDRCDGNGVTEYRCVGNEGRGETMSCPAGCSMDESVGAGRCNTSFPITNTLWDIDSNGILEYTFGSSVEERGADFRNLASELSLYRAGAPLDVRLNQLVLGTGARRTREQVLSFLDCLIDDASLLDIDGNGSINNVTDPRLIAVMVAQSGSNISSFLGPGATRTTTQAIAGYLNNNQLGVNCIQIAVCGNGRIEPPEQCDGSSDCSSSCQIIPRCGDGIINKEGEECDYGDVTNSDGCSNECKFEFCGDGTVQSPQEQCDDGNTRLGDGCNPWCKTQ